MVPEASCTDRWVVDLVETARWRFAQFGITVSLLTASATALAAEAQWQSEAARAFRDESEAIVADIRCLVDRLDEIGDDLAAVAARRAAAPWGCG